APFCRTEKGGPGLSQAIQFANRHRVVRGWAHVLPGVFEEWKRLGAHVAANLLVVHENEPGSRGNDRGKVTPENPSHVQPFDEPEKLARMHDGQWLETGRLVGGLESRVVPDPLPLCIDKDVLGVPPLHAFVTPDPRPDPIDRHIPAWPEGSRPGVG